MNNLNYIGVYDDYIINFNKWWNYITKDILNYHFLFTNLYDKIGISCLNNQHNSILRLFISLNSLEYYNELEFIIKVILNKKDINNILKYCNYKYNNNDNTYEYYINITSNFIKN